jgi:hypothetical protein
VNDFEFVAHVEARLAKLKGKCYRDSWANLHRLATINGGMAFLRILSAKVGHSTRYHLRTATVRHLVHRWKVQRAAEVARKLKEAK